MPFCFPGSQGHGLQKSLGSSCPSALLSSSLLYAQKFRFFCFYRECATPSTHMESPQPCFHHFQLSGTVSFCRFRASLSPQLLQIQNIIDMMKLQKWTMIKNDAMSLSNLLCVPPPPPHTHTHTHTHTLLDVSPWTSYLTFLNLLTLHFSHRFDLRRSHSKCLVNNHSVSEGTHSADICHLHNVCQALGSPKKRNRDGKI